MKADFLYIESSDKLLLPGLLFEPPAPTKRLAIWLHGMGGSGVFYKPVLINALAEALAKKGIALLAFNNRGAGTSQKFKVLDDSLPEDEQTVTIGTHYERIADCVKDITGAVQWSNDHGFSELYLVGHSTGANKICSYDSQVSRTPFAKYVLAGPGDDSGLFYNELGAARFNQALRYAKNAIAQGHPTKLMPKYTGMYPFRAQAAEDILDPNGDYNTFPCFEAAHKRLGTKPLFKEYKAIKTPMQIIYGAADEYTYTGGGTTQTLEIFRAHTHPSIVRHSVFTQVPMADHSFSGHESAFANTVAEWLD
jgi:alpha-beta hydrolase superfamily lysophospholipase